MLSFNRPLLSTANVAFSWNLLSAYHWSMAGSAIRDATFFGVFHRLVRRAAFAWLCGSAVECAFFSKMSGRQDLLVSRSGNGT